MKQKFFRAPGRDTDRAGLDLNAVEATLVEAPAERRRTRVGAWLGAVLAVGLGVGALTAPLGVAAAVTGDDIAAYWKSLPSQLPLEKSLPQHTVLLDADGKEFARFYSENRVDVKREDISANFVDALIATEDARFYEHHGADPLGIVRAALHNTGSGGRQGASTITQQLVQNMLINSARDETEQRVAHGTTPNDKIREIKYAVTLEKELSKDEILTRYANTVYFGNGAYGVEAAARTYFSTSAKNLTVPQAATLVGLLRGPTVYDPFTHPDSARARRDVVLGRMHAVGALDAGRLATAVAAPLAVARGSLPNGCGTSTYPWYCSLVRQEILTDPAFGATAEEREDRLSRGGMTLTTALDRKAMTSANTAVHRALEDTNRGALGLAVVTPGTGKVTAVAQNRGWGSGPGRTEITYATSTFQPGSTMKPITLATALEQGIPATTRLHAMPFYTPAALAAPEGGYSNYGLQDFGWVDARGAIKVSSNTYFIQLIEKTGVLPVADMAARLGITSLPRTGPRAMTGNEAYLTLGAYEVSPVQMANAYATFVAGGTECRPHTIVAATRSDTGATLPVPDADCHQAIAPAVANTVGDALKQTFSPGGTIGPYGALDGRESGAKTGTTNDYQANWIVGVTPQASTAVWLGDPRGGAAHPLTELTAYGRQFTDLTGAEVAAPVWKETMTGLLKGVKPVPMPRADDAATSSSTTRYVPDVRGLSVEAAMSQLLANDLDPVIEKQTAPARPPIGPGIVTAQTPAAGAVTGHRQQIRLTLSAGSDTSLRPPERDR
ncbi:carboxypeptidase [Tersicoccus solisilvae]|uniref:Carboxypeptidase n=1 Tax=Tersicoccus solisilvae TaxID=1882339 RepID=A0ABQ1NT28_9MICC|nr:transglycosylase domain-containing protein [Tersicoccus solisilvae]GGC82075.1 carboxypeptidase [Tersicoccus solisilvae]